MGAIDFCVVLGKRKGGDVTTQSGGYALDQSGGCIVDQLRKELSSWLLNWMLGLYRHKLMTVEQHISLADVILGVHVAVSIVQVMTKGFFLLSCLIREWLRGEDNAGNLK